MRGLMYCIIGNGRMSKHMQFYFKGIGVKYEVWSRHDNIEQLNHAIDQSTHVLILINDAAIVPFIQEGSDKLRNKLLIHFSGSLHTNLAVGAHPFMMAGKTLYPLDEYKKIPFVIDEGYVFSDLFPSLENPHFNIHKDKKPLYHALAVLGANGSILLWQKAIQEFQKQLGLPKEVLLSCIRQVAQNLEKNEKEALTGPLVRNDLETISRNLRSLNNDPYKDVYQSLVKAYSSDNRKDSFKVKNILHFLEAKKIKRRLSMTTAYDHWSAALLNETLIDCILVGDSAAMVMHGYSNTIHATIEMMILHTAAVCKGAPDKFVIADLPFLSYRKSISETMSFIDQFMKAGAKAIKLEGARENLSTIKYIVDSGIPVMGHIGLTPQTFHQLGGNRIQGKDADSAARILQDALDLQEHGCFSVLLECIPQELAKEITDKLQIPTIGVGAGVYCDGQALVLHDILGLLNDFKPKFVKKYCDGHSMFTSAVNQFANEVARETFPSSTHSFSRPLMKSTT